MKTSNWAVNIFAQWLRLREVQAPVLDCGGVFKDYELHKVQALHADIQNGCSFAELLRVQIRFNPLDANDKGYCESSMLNI